MGSSYGDDERRVCGTVNRERVPVNWSAGPVDLIGVAERHPKQIPVDLGSNPSAPTFSFTFARAGLGGRTFCRRRGSRYRLMTPTAPKRVSADPGGHQSQGN